MDSRTLSVSHLLLPLGFLSSSSSHNNHFVKLISSSTNINHHRVTSTTTTPLAIADEDTVPTTLRQLCQSHVPDQLLQRQFQL